MDETTPTQAASAAGSAEPENLAVAVPYQEFCSGLPVGRFRLIVNPDKAYRYVRHRLYLNGISIPLLGIGIALGLVGHLVPGSIFCVIGFTLRWVVKKQGPRILLHLVQHDPRVYYDALEYEIMEVRMARD
ncbi:MAG TPA: hypothetical protein VN028_05720 [Rhodocyclaceae bacterium]|nr:hypothetical protein [Rhodocyclaceae bacterium]